MLKTFKKIEKQKQHRILNAAANIFAARGYYQANIADICKAACISNGALYKYFKNKEDLFNTIVNHGLELLFARIDEFSGTDYSFWETLNQIFTEVIPFVEINRDYVIVYLDLGSHSMDKFASNLSDIIESPARDFWKILVKKGKKNGEIRESIDTEAATFLIDNYITLFAFSCISEHYHKRFHRYFEMRYGKFKPQQKTKIVMQSLKQFLK